MGAWGSTATTLKPEFKYTHDRLGAKILTYKQLPSPPHSDKIEISICVPLYNRGKIIEKSLLSILNQNFPKQNYEVIFIDDASRDNTREVLKDIFDRYPEFNMRAYFRTESTTFNDAAPFNIAFRLAKGWILVLNQIDIIHRGEVLEAIWRHHNYYSNLFLCPLHLGETPDGKLVEWGRQFVPHEFGSSLRKEWVMKIKGRNETILRHPADVEFHWRLNRAGVVFGEDHTIATIHRHDAHGPETWDRSYHLHPNVPPYNPNWNPQDREWGKYWEIPPQNVLMTHAMKKSLGLT
jgi:glycosyltransferase involved in cell wall biosynthesis